MKQIGRFFLQGLLLTAPIFVTAYVFYLLISLIDVPVNDIIEDYLGRRIPGLGLLLVLVIITTIGALSSFILFKPFFIFLESLMERTPLVKIIYSSIRDLFSAFVSDKRRFDQPVAVEMGKDTGVFRVGFVTRKELMTDVLKDKVAVYIPHSYNFSGNLYIVNADQVHKLDISSTEAMKFAVSGGVTDWDKQSNA